MSKDKKCNELLEELRKITDEKKIKSFLEKNSDGECSKKIRDFIDKLQDKEKSKYKKILDEIEKQSSKNKKTKNEQLDKFDSNSSSKTFILKLEKYFENKKRNVEQLKGILKSISSQPTTEQTEIFKAIAELEVKKQTEIFKAIAELESVSLGSLYIKLLLKTYTNFINESKIDKSFLKKPFKNYCKALYFHTKVDTFEDKQIQKTLRESLYSLYKKIEDEDELLFEELQLKDVEKYFNDLHKKFEIRESKKFQTKKLDQKRKLDTFKNSILSDKEYRERLLEIAQNRVYIEDFVMFDFVMYLIENFSHSDFIRESDKRLSYQYFKYNRYTHNIQIMLNELFTAFGFCLFKNDDKYSKEISFEELLEASYSTDESFQTRLLEKYERHPHKIYLYYVLSKNRAITKKASSKILEGLQHLGLPYPYSDDIATMISVIKGNIALTTPDDLGKDKKPELGKSIDLYTYSVHDVFKTEGLEFAHLEELALDIKYKKSSSMMQYFEALSSFLESLNKITPNKKDYEFKSYKSYVADVIDNDYRLTYYYEFYFPYIVDKLKRNDDIEFEDYEFAFALKFLKIQKFKTKLKEHNTTSDYFIDFFYSKINMLIEKYLVSKNKNTNILIRLISYKQDLIGEQNDTTN